jgi:hypothetical protein
VLVRLADYIQNGFVEGSRPCAATARALAQRDRLPYHAMQVGGRWYVDLSRPNDDSAPVERPKPPARAMGNLLFRKIVGV